MENGPVLKKVRRPINRLMPVSSSEPTDIPNNKSSSPSNNEVIQTSVNDKPEIGFKTNSPVVSSQLPSVEKVSQQQNETSYEYNNQSYGEEYFEDDFSESENGLNISVKVLAIVVIISLVVGLFMGRFLFGGAQVTQNGLQGVVVNAEVPRGRARCGVADRTQGCVIYIMNSQRQNVRAKDFYEMAAQVTGRQKFMIETGNMRYANMEIRPGDIAQINIPPL